MTYIRSDIRTLIRSAIDPGSTKFTDAELNGWIAESVIELSQLLPVRLTHTETLTGSSTAVNGRLRTLEYVSIDGTYYDPLHQAETGFVGSYYHAEILANTTVFTFTSTLTSAAVEIVYHAETTQTDSDSADFALPDHHAPLLVLNVTAWAWTRKHAKSIIDGDDLALTSRYLVASNDAWEDYYLALLAARAEYETTMQGTYNL